MVKKGVWGRGKNKQQRDVGIARGMAAERNES